VIGAVCCAAWLLGIDRLGHAKHMHGHMPLGAPRACVVRRSVNALLLHPAARRPPCARRPEALNDLSYKGDLQVRVGVRSESKGLHCRCCWHVA
jgi:hypothetical protein